MRVAQIIDDLNYGGAEQLVTSLSAGLSRRGHEVVLICLREIGANPVDLREARAVGVAIVELHKPDGFHFSTLRRLGGVLRRRQIDVVHTHNHLVHHYAVIAARWVGVPAILNTLHGSASLEGSRKWSQWLYLASVLAGHRVVTVCPQVANFLRDNFFLPNGRLATVANGVNLQRFLQIERRSRANVLVFGSIGRLDPVKDYGNLLEAFALLKRRYPAIQLRILGDGSLLPKLQALTASLSIADSVVFEGFSLDTPDFLARIDVYVISSRSEGLPLSMLEAMGAGLPIVTTNVGEIPAIVQGADCGWLAERGNPQDLARAMHEAATAVDLSEKGGLSRRHARDRYTAERMVADYEALYRTLTARRSTLSRLSNQL